MRIFKNFDLQLMQKMYRGKIIRLQSKNNRTVDIFAQTKRNDELTLNVSSQI